MEWDENGNKTLIMKGYSVDRELFDRSVKQLLHEIIRKQSEKDYGTTEISFSVGYMREQEWYKREIFDSAQEILDVKSWTEDLIGTGRIVKRVVEAMRVRLDSTGTPQNLLNWREILYAEDRFTKNLTSSEKFLYELYSCENIESEKNCFDKAIECLGRRFPLISFLFFLKDRDRYVVIKPDKFKARFSRIGLTSDCYNKCTWENYGIFLSMLQFVRGELSKIFAEGVELIDAHSFVWMIWHIQDINPDEIVKDLVDEGELETVVVTMEKEGLIKKYYGTRYERNARNRSEAIRIHGYSCQACGFDFEKMYGELGKGYIEVHHNKPLYKLGGEVVVNPETDLTCLCSNCHKMIHRKCNYIMGLDELKEIIERNA